MYFVNETIDGLVCLNVKEPGFAAGIVKLRVKKIKLILIVCWKRLC